MIIQACINGRRPTDYHPRLPLTAEEMALDAYECVSAGAAEIHVHPRGADERESLAAVDKTVRAIRKLCPGTLIGVSTGAWIEGNEKRTLQCIAGWKELPDYASVNLSEPAAPAVIALLHEMGVGVEAGLATAEDAEMLAALPLAKRCLRVLIEIEQEQEVSAADAIVDEIAVALAQGGVRKPVLLHGCDNTVWHFVERARQGRWSTRVGLEDGSKLPGGNIAASNAQLVAAALCIYGGAAGNSKHSFPLSDDKTD